MSIASPSIAQPAVIDVPVRPDSTFLLGDLAAFKRDPLAFWISTVRQAPIVKIRFGSLTRYVISDADFAQHILQKNRLNYIKDQRLMRVLEAGSGRVLVTSDSEEWLWRRRLMQPMFNRSQIAHFADTIIAETERHLSRWQPGATLDMDSEMKTLTMHIIGRTMFNVDFRKESGALHHAYVTVGASITKRANQLFRLPLWAPTKDNRAFLRARDTIREALETIIRDRQNSPESPRDLLEMLRAAELEESNHKLTEEQVNHEMSALVFAGHETTATTLTWLLYVLSQYPEVAEKLRDELAGVLNGRKPTMADIGNLPYMQQVIDETMRLYPVLYMVSRQALAPDRFGDYEIPAGGRALISLLGIHRNPRYWDDPDSFLPERFDPGRRKPHECALMPFMAGPRKCIGGPLAMAELQLILPTIVQRFDLRLPQGVVVEPEAAVVLRPKGGLHMTAHPRRTPGAPNADWCK